VKEIMVIDKLVSNCLFGFMSKFSRESNKILSLRLILADEFQTLKKRKHILIQLLVLSVLFTGFILTVYSCNKDDQLPPEEELPEEKEEEKKDTVWTETLVDIPKKLEMIQTVSIGDNREIRVNGNPFFPIMSWAQSKSGVYPILKELGINTHAGYADSNAAKEAGTYCIADYTSSLPRNGHILALIYDDEPDMPQGQGVNSVPRQTPQEVNENIAGARQTFPNMLIFMTLTSHFMREQTRYPENVKSTIYPQFVSSPDVVGFDYYPIYGSGYPSRLDWVGSGTAQLAALAGPEKPVYAWIETSKGSQWMTYEKQPDVLPIHTRNEVWQAIINGATAIGYFTHAWKPAFKEFAPTEEMQNELKRINNQITRFSPAILAPPAQNNISMVLAGGLNGQFKATTFEGDLYIFAVNTDLGEGAENARQFDPISPRGGKAVFTVEGLKAGTQIEVIDEKRIITAQEGSFTDDFEPLAEHIYRILL